MAKKKQTEGINTTAITFIITATIAIVLGISYLHNAGYKQGQIDWQNGRKCVVLQTNGQGEKIYVDTCKFLK